MDDHTLQAEDILASETTVDRRPLPVRQQLMLLTAILMLIFVGASGTLISKVLGTSSSIAAEEGESPAIAATGAVTNDTEDPFAAITVRGKAAYVWDIKAQRALYKKNETDTLPLASVTKLMTALVAHELLAPQDPVAIKPSSLRQDGDSGFVDGETFTRQSLTDLTLMSSSNDGAHALAASAGATLAPDNATRAFVEAMNIRAKELGLNDTTFKNATGLDITETEAGSYGTAKDIAFLMEYIVKNEPDLLKFTQESAARLYSEDGASHDAENTNYYIDELPGVIGSKTGYTTLAGGNLVVAFNAGLDRPIIVVVLGSTRQERFTDVVRLAKAAESYVSYHK